MTANAARHAANNVAERGAGSCGRAYARAESGIALRFNEVRCASLLARRAWCSFARSVGAFAPRGEVTGGAFSMYATCLFCRSHLGSNEAVEAFPVGRRLAFDAAQGRLWVVCTACG